MSPINFNEFFTYKNGKLFWLVDRGSNKLRGKQAGSVGKDGYRQIQLNNRTYKEHRIIWELEKGAIPEGLEVDHKNRNKVDNNLSNLRLATGSENCANTVAKKTNKSGFKGVSFHKVVKKYQASITYKRLKRNLGYFNTAEEASAAYLKAANLLFKEFARTS